MSPRFLTHVGYVVQQRPLWSDSNGANPSLSCLPHAGDVQRVTNTREILELADLSFIPWVSNSSVLLVSTKNQCLVNRGCFPNTMDFLNIYNWGLDGGLFVHQHAWALELFIAENNRPTREIDRSVLLPKNEVFAVSRIFLVEVSCETVSSTRATNHLFLQLSHWYFPLYSKHHHCGETLSW